MIDLGSLLVVKSSLQDDDVFAFDLVDQTVLLVDPPGPASGKHVTQGLRFADPIEGLAKDVRNQAIDPLERGLVRRLPEAIVLPPVRREN